MATNTFGVDEMKPKQPKMQLPAVGSPAPVQFNPAAFAPMVAPFAAAFNQASQAEATGIADLRLQRLLDTMLKQRQAAAADAVLPYAGQNAALQGANMQSEIYSRDQMLPLLMQHMQGQTGLLGAQAQAVPQEATARLLNAQSVQQGAQNDALQSLIQAMAWGGPLNPNGNLSPAMQQVLMQRLGIVLPKVNQTGPVDINSGIPAQPNGLANKIAAFGGGLAEGAAGGLGALAGLATGPVAPVASPALGLALPALLHYLLQQVPQTAEAMNQNPGMVLAGGLTSGVPGVKAYRAQKATAAAPKAKPVSGANIPQPQQRPLPPTVQPTPQNPSGFQDLNQLQQLLQSMGMQPGTPAYIETFKKLAGL